TANITKFISKSSSPSYAVEGKKFTLDWNYILDGTIRYAQYFIVKGHGNDLLIGQSSGPGKVTVQGGFQARFRADVTDTRAQLTILAVQRSDEGTYKLTILPTGAGSISELVTVVVNWDYRCTAENGVGTPSTRIPPSIIGITGNTLVIEGGNLNLNCSAKGKPKPRITWTRLSDNSVVTMPLININRHDAGDYRCTAENGVGMPSTRNAPKGVTLTTNLSRNHHVCVGMVANFTCVVEASNPAVENLTLLGTGSVGSNKRDSGVWIRTLTSGDNAAYKCMASNSVGVTCSDYINFMVEVPASITSISNSIVLKEGQNVTLVCHGLDSRHQVSPGVMPGMW
ncbi:hypothetical protein P5673_020339, partial [Acropora cervicornis]